MNSGKHNPARASAAALLSAICLTSVPLGAREPVRARHGMVVAAEDHAADVGLSILKAGGNAVDAAVAVGFALAVTHPFAGNIGGGGFMLIRFADGRTTFIDFRERAPERASRNMYLDSGGTPTNESVRGWRSSGVPGSVRGFELANRKYGRKKWAELIAPAIELASRGFQIPYSMAQSLRATETLSEDPESKRILLNNGAYFEPGDTVKQPELAATLRRIANNGGNEFYEGETARRFAAEMASHGGLITLPDLQNYKAIERVPLTGTYRNYSIITAPLPSSGGIGLLQMLGMLEGSGYEKSGPSSAAAIHYTAEVMRRFFADRAEYLGDPDFVSVPAVRLLDPSYIKQRRASINPARATPSTDIGPGLGPLPKSAIALRRESTETTHYSIVDAEGNAVAVTYTLNDAYGNGIIVPGLGFLLNDEMDDFASKPGFPNLFGLVQSEANAIQPGKRPLSSMTPTIVLKDSKLFMVLGSPGGPRITTAVLQTILNVVDFQMNIQDAVDAPRFHHQWSPDVLYLERGISPDTVALLTQRGHKVEYSPGVVLARVEAILVEDHGTGQGQISGRWIAGAADGRWSGKASGY